MFAVFTLISLSGIFCIALSSTSVIVIIHDGTASQFDPALEWPQKLNLFLTYIKLRYPSMQLISATSLLSSITQLSFVAYCNTSLLVDKRCYGQRNRLIGLITMARCFKGNTLESVARKMYPRIPLLRINTEYCHEPNGLLLTWAKVHWPCFAYVIQDWLRQVFLRYSFAMRKENVLQNGVLNIYCPFGMKTATHLMDAYEAKYKRNLLSGQKIRLGAMNSSLTLLYKNPSNPKSFRYAGVLFEHMELLAKMNNYTFELVVQEVERIGAKMNNGSWTGLLGLAANHAFDLASYAVGYEHSRYEVVDWSFSASDNIFAFIIPVPREEKYWLASAQPYSYVVWIIIFAVWILLTLFTAFYNRLEAFICPYVVADRNTSWTWHLFNYQRVLFNQGGDDTMKQVPNRILLGFWCILALVVVNLYTSVLIGYLTVPQIQPVIRNLGDLAQSSRVRMVFLNEHIVTTMFMNPFATGYPSIIGQRAKKYPEDFVNTRKEAVEKVAKGAYVFGEALSPGHAAIAEDFRTHGRCRVLLLRDDFLTVRASYFTPKGHPYWHFFYTSLARITEAAVLKVINRKLLERSPCVDLKSFVSSPTHSLTFPELISPYSLYAIGLGVAVIIFLFERLIHLRMYAND